MTGGQCPPLHVPKGEQGRGLPWGLLPGDSWAFSGLFCSLFLAWGRDGQQVTQGALSLCPQGVPQGHSPGQIRAWGPHHRGPQLLSHCSSLEATGADRNSLPGLGIIPATPQGGFVTFPKSYKCP